MILGENLAHLGENAGHARCARGRAAHGGRGENGDILVPQLEQVPRGKHARLEVVQLHDVAGDMARPVADRDDGNAGVGVGIGRVVIRRIEEDDAEIVVLEGHLEIGALKRGIVVGTCGDDRNALGDGRAVDALDHGAVVRVRGLHGDDEHRTVRGGRRGAAELIVQRRGRGEYLFDRSGGEGTGFLVQDHGDGGLRNAGRLCDILHSDAFGSHKHLL